jgi:hypothetical protein
MLSSWFKLFSYHINFWWFVGGQLSRLLVYSNKFHEDWWTLNFVYYLCYSTVGWGIVPQAGRLRMRFPIGSLLTQSFRPHYGPVVKSASDINGGKGGWCVGLTTLPPSCPDVWKSWQPQPPGAGGVYWACMAIALLLPLIYVIDIKI